MDLPQPAGCPQAASESGVSTRARSSRRKPNTSSVGVKVAEEHLGAAPMITLATAHPAKFPDAVEKAVGIRPELPPHMAGLFDRPERVTRVENDVEALKSLILERRTA